MKQTSPDFSPDKIISRNKKKKKKERNIAKRQELLRVGRRIACWGHEGKVEFWCCPHPTITHKSNTRGTGISFEAPAPQGHLFGENMSVSSRTQKYRTILH